MDPTDSMDPEGPSQYDDYDTDCNKQHMYEVALRQRLALSASTVLTMKTWFAALTQMAFVTLIACTIVSSLTRFLGIAGC